MSDNHFHATSGPQLSLQLLVPKFLKSILASGPHSTFQDLNKKGGLSNELEKTMDKQILKARANPSIQHFVENSPIDSLHLFKECQDRNPKGVSLLNH